MRRASLVVALLPSLAICAEPSWNTWGWPTETLAEHRDGAAHWYEGAQRIAIARCARTRSCEDLVIHIRNDSARTIQCRVSLERPEADENGHVRIEGDKLVEPGRSIDVVRSRGARVSVPSVSSSCRLLDAHLPALAAQTGSCESEILPPDDLERFYPPGSSRREEAGIVTLDFVIRAGEPQAREVRVTASSGYGDIDNAALKAAHASKVRTDCLEAVVRRRIHFEKQPNERPSVGDFIASGDTTIWFED